MIHITEFLVKKHLSKMINDDIIDLDLPSGTKWAKYNIGAEKPEDVGLFFLWGQIKGYKFNEVAEHFIDPDKLKSESGKVYKNGETLDNEDDAAYLYTNGSLRMPTKEEIEELMEHTDHNWSDKLNGVKGIKFVSKKDPDKFIFIPETDIYLFYKNKPTCVNNGICTWGSTCGKHHPYKNADTAYLLFLSFGSFIATDDVQSDSYPIRPVLK